MRWIINKIKQFYYRFFKRYSISPSGDCLIRYIIKKYINNEEDNITAYEEYIDHMTKYVPLYPAAEKIVQNSPEEEREQVKHEISAIIIIGRMLKYSNNKEGTNYFSLIKNEEIKQLLNETIRKL